VPNGTLKNLQVITKFCIFSQHKHEYSEKSLLLYFFLHICEQNTDLIITPFPIMVKQIIFTTVKVNIFLSFYDQWFLNIFLFLSTVYSMFLILCLGPKQETKYARYCR